MRRVPVQRSAVLGFLTPVAAPIFALGPPGPAHHGVDGAGGALILAAGILVVLLDQQRPRVGAAAVSGHGSQGHGSRAGAGRGDPAGYALVVGSYLLFGLSATLVTWADAPESVLLVDPLRTCGDRPAPVFARRQPARRASSGAASGSASADGRARCLHDARLLLRRARHRGGHRDVLPLPAARVGGVPRAAVPAHRHRESRLRRPGDRRARHGPDPPAVAHRRRRGSCRLRPGGRLRGRLELRLLPDAREAADARDLERDRGDRRERARRRVHPAARPVAVRGCGSTAHRPRLGVGRGHGPRHHGARLHHVGRGTWRGSGCSTARSSASITPVAAPIYAFVFSGRASRRGRSPAAH